MNFILYLVSPAFLPLFFYSLKNWRGNWSCKKTRSQRTWVSGEESIGKKLLYKKNTVIYEYSFINDFSTSFYFLFFSKIHIISKHHKILMLLSSNLINSKIQKYFLKCDYFCCLLVGPDVWIYVRLITNTVQELSRRPRTLLSWSRTSPVHKLFLRRGGGGAWE